MNTFISVSGGKDSTALAILYGKEWECVFADTGDEFPQVYKHLERMESVLGIKIERVRNKQYTLREYELYMKFFPSIRARYCTRMFKIRPIEQYLEQHAPYKLAIGLRCDERELREGNTSDYAIYPLIEQKIDKQGVIDICNEHDLMPQYPSYMSRGGCYSCFFKKLSEIVGLYRNEPELYAELVDREKTAQDKRGEYYYMLEHAGMSLEKLAELIEASGEQLPLFNYDEDYEHAPCGMYCRR